MPNLVNCSLRKASAPGPVKEAEHPITISVSVTPCWAMAGTAGSSASAEVRSQSMVRMGVLLSGVRVPLANKCCE